MLEGGAWAMLNFSMLDIELLFFIIQQILFLSLYDRNPHKWEKPAGNM